MPGLLRGVARVAVASGTATAVSNRVSRRQAGRWAEQNQQAHQQQPVEAAPQPSAQGGDMQGKLDQLKDLAQLKEQGVLTDAEFAAQKQQILGS
jgi:hypothetical protein